MTTNKHVLTWIDEMAALTCPDTHDAWNLRRTRPIRPDSNSSSRFLRRRKTGGAFPETGYYH